MNRIWAIAWNTCREAIRDRVLYSILFFAGLVLVLSLMAEEITIGDQEKVVRGVAQGAVSLFSSIIAMFLGVGLVWKELERKTIYTIASKPIPRWMFLVGKYLGLLLTLTMNVGLMMALYFVVLTAQQGLPHPNILAFVVLLLLKLMLLTAWATLFSTYSGPTTATAFTLSIFVIGHVADDIWLFGQQAESPMIRQISAALYWVLPNFEMFNVQAQTTHLLPVSLSYVAQAAAYGLGYTVVVLAAAVAIFQRRDFK